MNYCIEAISTMRQFIRKHLRSIIGIVVLLFGIVFMFIPFIPLGYILLAVGAYLLAPWLPFMRKLLRYLKKKDKRDRIEKTEEKVDEVFEQIKEKL